MQRQSAPDMAGASRSVLGGARAVVPLTTALLIPLTSASGAPLPRRDLILVLATTVIVVSPIVQRLTLEPLVRRAGIARDTSARHEETLTRLRLVEAALVGWMNSRPTTAPPIRDRPGPTTISAATCWISGGAWPAASTGWRSPRRSARRHRQWSHTRRRPPVARLPCLS
jgi:NhaP-type Na+/H+ or K+/H+ antiporter